MNEHWISFGVVIFVQLVLFVLHAWNEKRLRELPRILLLSILIGIPFGIVFDLLIGKVLSFYDYELGFGLYFLTINGALSYGLMQANTLLMERDKFLHFYIWTILVGFVYEVTNYFFRVWNWDFASTPFEILVVHLIGYIGLGTMMALVWHYILGHRFTFITKTLSSLR